VVPGYVIFLSVDFGAMQFAFLLLLLACLSIVSGQSGFPGANYNPATYPQYSICQPYGKVPASCNDFVDSDIWVPTNYTQQEIQNEVSNYAVIGKPWILPSPTKYGILRSLPQIRSYRTFPLHLAKPSSWSWHVVPLSDNATTKPFKWGIWPKVSLSLNLAMHRSNRLLISK